MGTLALHLVCHIVPPEAGRRAGLEVMRVEVCPYPLSAAALGMLAGDRLESSPW